jgi:hypothetical protein
LSGKRVFWLQVKLMCPPLPVRMLYLRIFLLHLPD